VARIVVDVMLRKEIHDPQGEAIASAAHRLGFGQVLGVRQQTGHRPWQPW